jgi:hypothetical protein
LFFAVFGGVPEAIQKTRVALQDFKQTIQVAKDFPANKLLYNKSPLTRIDAVQCG